MRVEYDPIANAAYIRIRETEIIESEEITDGVVSCLIFLRWLFRRMF